MKFHSPCSILDEEGAEKQKREDMFVFYYPAKFSL